MFFRLSGELGLGGGIDLFSMQELTSTGNNITLDMIEGNDLEYNLDIGPISLVLEGIKLIQDLVE